MATKQIQIAPIQQIVPIPSQCDLTIKGDADFQYALLSQTELDENKVNFRQSIGGSVTLPNNGPTILALKSNGNMCNATITVTQPSVAPVTQTQSQVQKSNGINISVFIWIALIVLVVVVVMKKK